MLSYIYIKGKQNPPLCPKMSKNVDKKAKSHALPAWFPSLFQRSLTICSALPKIISSTSPPMKLLNILVLTLLSS